MKNLELLDIALRALPEALNNVNLCCHGKDGLYFIRDEILVMFEFAHGAIVDLCPKPLFNVIRMKLVTIECRICVATSEFLYIFDFEGNETHVMNFEHEVVEICWNPSEDIICIISKQGDIATYSVDYENGELYLQGRSHVLTEVPETVYVGWGSKETQFRGSEGKRKAEVPVAEMAIFDEQPAISWRGNGELFAVNYWESQRRKFLILDTICNALYRSEFCPGLQPQIAWRPTGNMIATITNNENVTIFEKNGQQRFTFPLDFDNLTVKAVKWSPCSHILLIQSEHRTSCAQNLHLFTSSNYRWYEKQKLIFTIDNQLIDYDWQSTNQSVYTLIVTTTNHIIRYTFRSVTIANATSIMAVIDGRHLQLIDFKDAITPPPMFSNRITNEHVINLVCFQDDNHVAFIDCQDNLKMYSLSNLENVILEMNLRLRVNDCPPYPLAFYNLHYKEGNDIYYTVAMPTGPIVYCLNDNNISVKTISAPQNSTSNVKFATVNNMTFTLTVNCQFHINDSKISDGVNSFFIYDNYLLYTTKVSELFCIRLDEKSILKLIESGKIFRRSIEQGAMIVSAIPNSPHIILQMPRGNLETISCRLVSIDILDRLLNEQKWEEALRFIRLEKLNANLLFDIDSNRFLMAIDRFIECVKTVNELNSICLEMVEGNVLNTIYQNCWHSTREIPGKINTIFSKIFDYFDKVGYVPYITTIVIVNLRFFTLRDALIYLQDLYKKSTDTIWMKKYLMDAIGTLKMYECDHEQLFLECLLLYDLDLANFVASCCQMDPRIYEPQLEKLKNMTELMRRFQINLLAKKIKIAISYLLRIDDTNPEIIENIIKKHQVSHEAYANCPKNSQYHQIVAKLFANDLSKQGNHQEAGLVLKRAKLTKEALLEYKMALNWRQVLHLMNELNVEAVEKTRIINELALGLVQRRLIPDAAILLEFYANNYEMAIHYLVEHFYIKEALHIATKHNRHDVIVADIVPMLVKHQQYLEDKLNNLNILYDKYIGRLRQVRHAKLDKMTNFHCDNDNDDLFSEVGSVVSTRSSRSSKSRLSTLSSRNRRKEDRKKQDLREGGIYEDIALIRALHSTIKEIFDKNPEVCDCCIYLMQESDTDYCQLNKFYHFYWDIVHKVKVGISEIWPPHFYTTRSETLEPQQLADLDNLEHLDLEFRTPPHCNVGSKLSLF